MPRTLALFTGPWTDQPLEVIVAKANEWGYQALDLACWGEHVAVQRALAEPAYCRSILDTLEQHELSLVALSCHPIGQAIADRLDARHQASLPEWIWGDGDADAVVARATQELIDTSKVAQQLGVNLVVGSTGSPFTASHAGLPPVTPSYLEEGWRTFNTRWKPILDAMAKAGCRYACEIHPAQTAFDLLSADATLQALEGHPAFSFAFNPASLHWQGVDPGEFLRGQAERISHVLIQDVAVTLNGRNSLLGSLLAVNDARRGWSSRAPGLGNIDWPSILRTLHQIRYQGPLTVAFQDVEMDRDYGAAEALGLLRRLDFPSSSREEGLFG